MRGILCIEGANKTDSASIRRCREAFSKLFASAGVQVNKLRLLPCGSRNDAFGTFRSKVGEEGVFVALLVDSEDAVADNEKPWDHLHLRDGWQRPEGVIDKQALLMIACMETWIAADALSLRKHFGQGFKEKALPSLHDLEKKHRHAVLDCLEKAAKDCRSQYTKGDRSFQILADLNPEVLTKHLPSFERTVRILKDKIK